MIKSTRHLTKKESTIICALIDAGEKKWAYLKQSLAHTLVTVMSDGDMGSLRFETMESQERHLKTVISEAEFTDNDGVLVSITLNLDQNGQLFELDVWKVDFKPLISFPLVSDINFK